MPAGNWSSLVYAVHHDGHHGAGHNFNDHATTGPVADPRDCPLEQGGLKPERTANIESASKKSWGRLTGQTAPADKIAYNLPSSRSTFLTHPGAGCFPWLQWPVLHLLFLLDRRRCGVAIKRDRQVFVNRLPLAVVLMIQ